MKRTLTTMAALGALTLATGTAFAGTSGHHPFMNPGSTMFHVVDRAPYALTGEQMQRRDANRYNAGYDDGQRRDANQYDSRYNDAQRRDANRYDNTRPSQELRQEANRYDNRVNDANRNDNLMRDQRSDWDTRSNANRVDTSNDATRRTTTQYDSRTNDANRNDTLKSEQRSEWNRNDAQRQSSDVRVQDLDNQAKADLNRETYRSTLDGNTDGARTYDQRNERNELRTDRIDQRSDQTDSTLRVYRDDTNQPNRASTTNQGQSELKPEWVWKGSHGRTVIFVIDNE